MMSLLPFWDLNVSVLLLSMQGQKALGFHQKHLNLCSKDEHKSYGFGTTWGWVINDRIFIFWVNYPFNITLYKTVEWEFFIHHQLIRSRPSLRSKLRSRGNGGDGTSKGFWVLTPNTSTHPWAAMATTSARRSPCWLAAAPRLAAHLHVKTRRPSQSNLASTTMWYCHQNETVRGHEDVQEVF